MAILGIDEVGRGPWAGPLVIGAVVLPTEKPDWVADLRDSKKLSAKKREALNEIILREAPVAALGWVKSAEIDQLGLAKSLRVACHRAVKSAQKIAQSKSIHFSEIIIDGNTNFLAGTPLEKFTTTLIKGDDLIKEISAASIIAKVARDHYMYDLAQKFPNYGFEKHVGYGTAAHKNALAEFGPCPEHRYSFKPLEKFFSAGRGDKKDFIPESSGAKAESIVADYLESEGHQIIARNHKTKFYEIDIISTKADKIYFTEVKYRAKTFHGHPLEFITKDKLNQMTFAAESFLKFQPQLKEKFSPILAAAAVSGTDFQIDDWFTIQ